MLGHVLRSDENTAAHQALAYAVETPIVLVEEERHKSTSQFVYCFKRGSRIKRDFNFSNFEEFNSLGSS